MFFFVCFLFVKGDDTNVVLVNVHENIGHPSGNNVRIQFIALVTKCSAKSCHPLFHVDLVVMVFVTHSEHSHDLLFLGTKVGNSNVQKILSKLCKTPL